MMTELFCKGPNISSFITVCCILYLAMFLTISDIFNAADTAASDGTEELFPIEYNQL